MSGILIAILIIAAVLVIGYYLAKRFMLLLVNAILGLVLLFIVNLVHLMQWMGRPDLGYGLATVLISAIAGVPGVLILILLGIFGVSL